MAVCTNCGAEMRPGNRFCTSCGTPAATPTSGAPVPPQAGPAGLPPTPPSPPQSSPPQPSEAGFPVGQPGHDPGDDPTVIVAGAQAPVAPPHAEPAPGVEVEQTDGSGRRSRRPLVLIVAAIVVVGGLIAAAAVLLLRDGDEIAGGSDYRGPNDDLVFLQSFQGDGDVEISWARTDSDDRPVEFFNGEFFTSARLVGRGLRGSTLDAGGPVIAAVGEDGDRSVVVYDPDDDAFTELLGGGDDYDVYYDPDDDRALVVEFRSSNSRCYAGDPDDELLRVARADGCFFSPLGTYVLAYDRDDDELDFEVLDLEGRRVLRGSSLEVPAFTDDEASIVQIDGSADRATAQLVSLDSGEVVAESDRDAAASFLDSSADGEVLVGLHDGEGSGRLQLLRPNGSVVDLLENEGPFAVGFLDEEGTEVLVRSVTVDGTQLSIVRGVDGAEPSTDRVASDIWDVRLPFAGERNGHFVAVSREDDDEDALLLVSTDAGVVETDVDDYGPIGYLDDVELVGGDRMVITIGTEADEGVANSLLVASLTEGTVEYLLEDWAHINLSDALPSGESFAITGREERSDSDEVVAAVGVDGDVEIVDEADDVLRAIFSRNRDRLLYTTSDGDAYDTYRYELGERGRPELLYGDLRIQSAGWTNGTRSRVGGLMNFEVPLPTSYCDEELPGREVLVATGGEISASLDEFGTATFCLAVPADGDVTIEVSSTFDPVMNIYGDSNSYYDDDTNGSDPLISDFFEEGAYLVEITGYRGSSGSFTITASS